MMTLFDGAGQWAWTGTTDDLAALLAEAGDGAVIVAGQHGPADYWTGEAVAPRTSPPAPPAMVAGIEATWSGLPVGAVVTVTDPETGIVAGTDTADAAGEVQIGLPAGPWRIAVNEVFPALAASWLIEVAPE